MIIFSQINVFLSFTKGLILSHTLLINKYKKIRNMISINKYFQYYLLNKKQNNFNWTLVNKLRQPVQKDRIPNIYLI